MRPWTDDRIAANGRPVRENFAEWFGNGVQRFGEPRVLFHGTNRSFDAFDIAKGVLGQHFATSTQTSDEFAARPDGQVLPVYLNISNPLRVRDQGTWWSLEVIDELDRLRALKPHETMALRVALQQGKYDDALVRTALESAGYDGIVYLNRGEGLGAEDDSAGWESRWTDKRFAAKFPGASDSYIAFRPEQIKSAIGNSGLYAKDSASLNDQAAAAAWLKTRASMVKTVRRALTRGARL